MPLYIPNTNNWSLSRAEERERVKKKAKEIVDPKFTKLGEKFNLSK